MAVRVAITGFGRIGRLALRAVLEEKRWDEVEIVAINDSSTPETNAHLLTYDSVHGRYPGTIKVGDDWIDAGFGKIQKVSNRDPSQLPWGDMGVDLVLECTGKFNSKEASMAHIEGSGAKKVLCSAPAKNADKTIVYGVNHDTLTADDVVVSNASCTTNGLAPVAKVLNDAVGIERGHMTTIHAYTGDQPTLDRNHKDLHRARAAAMSMVPTSTGAAKAVGLVLPELVGKLDGAAVRVPTPNVSLIDLVFTPGRATTAEELTDAIKAAADGPMKGILGYDDIPLVSIDYNHDSRSSIVAVDKINVIDERLVRVMTWYDNEWGFACRMIDTAAAMGRFL
ncbi:type I glyceraldehyde-3-phosphate dehydrogenase [Hyphobacterium sp. HN65]|uniref:Glyceraldehyde-3-phosphate dehydrogenase n=1 Tax=Hyphobacterium lacteum TaxID=3116575 RepID=A0ABU7LP26_9PROT|nr:type I glyceraldehyde-3-phosphate dehydrogenase [Hyphobacterium sp. HN65]MEE2525642.1 type I glyceraldehyde-3-phosphate dehydrogenase [Hyphobacterium sp. HN65]